MDVIIITRDRPQIFKKCLDDLLQCNSNNCQIIIVDSSVSEVAIKMNQQTISRKENDYSHVGFKYVRCLLPLGTLPIARNIGLRFIKYKHILFLDDDAFCDDRVITVLKDLTDRYPKNHIFGVRIIQGTQVGKSEFEKNKPSFSIFRWSSGNYNSVGIGIQNIECVQGTCMCFSADALKKVGGFNENLSVGYASFEDTEICLKINKVFGSGAVFTDRACVTHGLAPRALGSRKLTSDADFLHSFARNGVITSKTKYGFCMTALALPIVLIINSLRIIREVKPIHLMKVIKLIYTFARGSAVGLAQ